MCKQLYGQLMILSTAGIMPITAGIIIPIFSIPFFFSISTLLLDFPQALTQSTS